MKTQEEIDACQFTLIKRLIISMAVMAALVIYLLASNHNDVSNKDFERFKALTQGITKKELSHAIDEARHEDNLIHGWAAGLIDRCYKAMERNKNNDACVKEIMKDGKHFNDRDYWIKEGYPLKK